MLHPNLWDCRGGWQPTGKGGHCHCLKSTLFTFNVKFKCDN